MFIEVTSYVSQNVKSKSFSYILRYNGIKCDEAFKYFAHQPVTKTCKNEEIVFANRRFAVIKNMNRGLKKCIQKVLNFVYKHSTRKQN